MMASEGQMEALVLEMGGSKPETGTFGREWVSWSEKFVRRK